MFRKLIFLTQDLVFFQTAAHQVLLVCQSANHFVNWLLILNALATNQTVVEIQPAMLVSLACTGKNPRQRRRKRRRRWRREAA